MKFLLPASCACTLILPAVLLSLLACQPKSPIGVVVITVDTLRADHMGAYGYRHNTSPHFDSLARESVLFHNAVAPSPWTLPSVATLFTSLYPAIHGATRASNAPESHEPGFKPNTRLADEFTTLPEILRDRGFQTAAFVQGAYPSLVYGFGQGFDHFDDNTSPGIGSSVDRLLEWLDREHPSRFLIYLHTIEVHSPYRPTPPNSHLVQKLDAEERRAFAATVREQAAHYRTFGRRSGYNGKVDGSIRNIQEMQFSKAGVSRNDKQHLIDLYDRGISYTDHWLGNLVTSLKERDLLERTLLIVTSDHGEEFWDHGGLEHGHTYYDELLRVPLLMRVPGEGRGVAVDQQVGLLDVLPTILDVMEVTPAEGIQGRSLRPLWTGGELPDITYFAESNLATPGLALRTNRWKMMWAPRETPRLYDLWNDPGEREDVCAQERETCQSLKGELKEWRQQMRQQREGLNLGAAPTAKPDADTIERLRALGYVD